MSVLRKFAVKSYRCVAFACAVCLLVAGWLVFDASTAAQAQSCPKGQVTCGQLCDLAAPNPYACKYDREDSCMSRFGNVSHCVGRNADNEGRERRPGSCPPGQMTCAAWCDKYRENPRGCKYQGAKSCVGMRGNIYWCHADRPPRD